MPPEYGHAEDGSLSIFHPDSPYAAHFESGAGLNPHYAPLGVPVSSKAVVDFHQRFGRTSVVAVIGVADLHSRIASAARPE